jgi:hypothetical protein
MPIVYGTSRHTQSSSARRTGATSERRSGHGDSASRRHSLAAPRPFIFPDDSWASDSDQSSVSFSATPPQDPETRVGAGEEDGEASDSGSDTIVLRTGEASRLRRRGAIQRDTKDKEREREHILICGRRLTEEEERLLNAELDDEDERRRPFKPSPLPICPLSTLADHPTASSEQERRRPRTTGCGAIVHLSAYPKTKQGVWTSSSPHSYSYQRATDAVVPYQPNSQTRSGCGCIRETIACCNWYVLHYFTTF